MLREKIPDFDPALIGVAPGVALPRMKEAVSVAFRSGADLTEVCSIVQGNRNVIVQAAPGAGKSTRLPLALSEASGRLVLHVFPSERLASHVAGYLNSVQQKVHLMLTVDDRYPDSGVVCASAAVVVAKWLAAGCVALPECIVYHDESHESDAYTYLVKTLSLTVSSVKCYVSATATVGAAGFRSFEPKGVLDRRTYEGPVTSWDPYDEGKPWSINLLRGNALLFVDSKTAAAGLVEAYAAAGFSAYRLHSRMALGDFQAIMDTYANPEAPIAVLVADSSFRSGYTFDVSTILDSGKIGYMNTSSGRPVRRERALYELEQFQSSARGARVPGLTTVYWAPAGHKPESCICDLAAVEMEAVALIYRMLGFLPPHEFATCTMASGDVPRELCAALQREQPLALMHPSLRVAPELVAVPSGRKSPFLEADVVDAGPVSADFVDNRISADVALDHGGQRYVKEERKAVAWDDSWQDDLEILIQPKTQVKDLKLGRAYCASGLETDSSESIVFPDGADSVLRMADGDGGLGGLRGIAAWHKSIAVNLLLSRQGALAAEMDGIRRAVKYARSDQEVAGSPAARTLAVKIAERLAVVSTMLGHVNDVLMVLGMGFCSYHEIELNVAVSSRVYDNWVNAWGSLPRSSNRQALESGFVVERENAGAVKTLTSHVVKRLSDRPYVPMLGKGSGMRAGRDLRVGSSSSGGSGSGGSDGRCTGSTYWDQSLARGPTGKLVSVRRLVCQVCGVGASKKMHGF